MRIGLIVPGRIDRTTGGSIYDRYLRDYLISEGNRVDILSIPDLPYQLSLLCSLPISAVLSIVLASRRYDLIVEDAWTHPGLAFLNLLRRTRKPRTAIIVHQLRSIEAKTRIGRLMAASVEKRALRSASLIITVSSYMRAEIEDLIGSAEIIVAPPGYDRLSTCQTSSNSQPEDRVPNRAACNETDRRAYDLPSPIKLLFVGNVVRRKGLDHLIRALSLLDNRAVKLDVIGDHSFDARFYRELRNLVASCSLEDVVTFHGSVSDVRLNALYKSADLLVMPSTYEGYGIVYAEAMQAGLPIIAARGGPVSEIVRDGENALLVPPGDPCSLAEAITSLSVDLEKRKAFGRTSLELASKLVTWRNTCKTIDRHFQRLLNSAPKTD